MKKNNSKNVDKQKIKRICLSILHVFCYICTFLFWVILIIGLTSKSSNVSTKSHRSRSIVPSNNNTSITITGEELWLRFYIDWDIIDSYDFSNTYISAYNSEETDVDYVDYSYDDKYSENGKGYLSYVYSGVNVNFIYDFSLGFFTLDFDSFEGDLLILSSSPSYDGYNPVLFNLYYGYIYADPNSDIFSDITDSTVAFIDTISEGLDSTFEIFYDDGITTIGYLTCIVVAVVLGYFSLRLIMGLIRLRG